MQELTSICDLAFCRAVIVADAALSGFRLRSISRLFVSPMGLWPLSRYLSREAQSTAGVVSGMSAYKPA